MRLNIVGNGFDLYHGLPCSYYYFGCYLLVNHPEFYVELASMYGFSYGIPTGYEDFEYGVEDVFWRYFEEKLGDLDSTWIEEKLEDDLGLECQDPVDIEIPESANSEVIKRYFQEWISSTLDLEQNFEIVKQNLGMKKIRWKKNDYFVNFNYSHTIEKVYNISSNRVFHIHGECGEDSELIVGHGNQEQINEYNDILEEMKNSSEYYGYQSTRNRYNEYNCELSILEDLRKNTSQLISDMERQLSWRAENVTEICVWGFSCGPVDMPYIERLNELYPNVAWSFSYYDLSEKNRREELVKNLGLSRVNYFELNNRDSERILSLIELENNITTFEKI